MLCKSGVNNYLASNMLLGKTCRSVQSKSSVTYSRLFHSRYCIRKTRSTGQCMPPPKHVLPVSRYGSRSGSGFVSGSWSPPKFNSLFIGPLPTFPDNLVQILLEVFFRKVANRQTNRQTNDDYVSFLAEIIITSLACRPLCRLRLQYHNILNS